MTNVKKSRAARCLISATLALVLFAPAPMTVAETRMVARVDAAPSSHPLISALKVGRDAAALLEGVSDYQATFVKKEIIGGQLVEQQMQIRFREEPMSVHLRFVVPHQGREVLFLEGRNSNKLLVKETGLASLVGAIALEPTSGMAMKETVYPITAIGIRNMLDRLLEHWLSETSSQDVSVKFYPNARIGKQECQVVEATHVEKSPQNQYHKLRLYVDKSTGLPIRVQQLGFPAADGAEPPTIADYTYVGLKTNLGLSDKDFVLSR